MGQASSSEDIVFHVALGLLVVMCALSICFLVYGGWNNVTVFVGGGILGPSFGTICGMLIKRHRSKSRDKQRLPARDADV